MKRHNEIKPPFTLKPALVGVVIAVALSGCSSVLPQLATQAEVQERVQQDVAHMYTDQEPISGPLTLETAVARTLKYNLDYRLKKMESAMALGVADYSKYDMWPSLLTNAGYNTRSNLSGGTSVGIDDGIQSLRPSTSQQRHILQTSAEFSWNVLDFGVSYFQAKQNANKFLVAEEHRRKLVQNMMQDVRAAYWRALGAQNLEQSVSVVLDKAKRALVKSREAETQKIISPALALNYQRALLDATSMLNQRRQDLVFAKNELAALMNVQPGTHFTLAQASEKPLPPITDDIESLETMALLQRPELREEDYKKRITAVETKKQMLKFLPNFNLAAGLNGNSNDFLANESWNTASIGVTWNLLKVFSLPALKQNQKQQELVDEAHRLALSMAILTQLRVSADRYKLAVEDYTLADAAASVDKRLASYAKASASAKLENDLEVVRTQARAVLGAYQRANAYANAQIAFGRLYNTLGFDALQDNFEDDNIDVLSAKIKQHFDQTENETIKFKSNLFDDDLHVSINIKGVQNAQLKTKMERSLESLLARNNIRHDKNGMPLTFSLKRNTKLSIEKAQWAIQLSDHTGEALESAAYATKIPEGSRASIVEATLIAAATSNLSDMKMWLNQINRAVN